MAREKVQELAKYVPVKSHVWKIQDNVGVPANCTPLLVFINAKSGGQMGASLLGEFYTLLNPVQVGFLAKLARLV